MADSLRTYRFSHRSIKRPTSLYPVHNYPSSKCPRFPTEFLDITKLHYPGPTTQQPSLNPPLPTATPYHPRNLTWVGPSSCPTSALLAHLFQKSGSSMSMSDRLPAVEKEALLKLEPFSSSNVITWVRFSRIWSMSSSQNCLPAVSSSMRAP